MNKATLLLIAVLVLIAVNAFLFTGAFLAAGPNYAFVTEFQGVVFASDDGNPIELLRKMTENNGINVAASFLPGNPRENSVLFNNTAISFVVVLSANDHNTVMINLNDSKNSENFSSCETNLGDVNTAVHLDAEICQSQLDDASFKTIFIPHPDSQNSKSLVLVSNDSVVLVARKYSDLPVLSLAVLRTMYRNTDDAIQRSSMVASMVST